MKAEQVFQLPSSIKKPATSLVDMMRAASHMPPSTMQPLYLSAFDARLSPSWISFGPPSCNTCFTEASPRH